MSTPLANAIFTYLFTLHQIANSQIENLSLGKKNLKVFSNFLTTLPPNFNFLGKPLLGEKYVEGRRKNIAFARGGAHLPIAHALRLLSTQELKLRKNNFLK